MTLSYGVKTNAISAAKTALLLDNTQLGSSQVQVSSAANLDDLGRENSRKRREGRRRS